MLLRYKSETVMQEDKQTLGQTACSTVPASCSEILCR